MIDIPLWLYLISLVVAVFFTYHVVDFIYFEKYMQFRNEMFTKHIETTLKVVELIKEIEEK